MYTPLVLGELSLLLLLLRASTLYNHTYVTLIDAYDMQALTGDEHQRATGAYTRRAACVDWGDWSCEEEIIFLAMSVFYFSLPRNGWKPGALWITGKNYRNTRRRIAYLNRC